MAKKYLNWGALTDDISETLILNQTTLAKKCKVTQQSVSNWKTGTRNPGVFARSILRELAAEAKLDLEDYSIKPFQKTSATGINEQEIPVPEEIMEFALKLGALPIKEREKIMDMAEFIISRGG